MVSNSHYDKPSRAFQERQENIKERFVNNALRSNMLVLDKDGGERIGDVEILVRHGSGL